MFDFAGRGGTSSEYGVYVPLLSALSPPTSSSSVSQWCVPPFCDVVERQFFEESKIDILVCLNRFLTLSAFDRGVTTPFERFRSLVIVKSVNRKSASKFTAEVKRFRHAHLRSRGKEIIDRLSPLSSTSLPKYAAILIFSRERIPPQFCASRSVSPLYLSPLIGWEDPEASG